VSGATTTLDVMRLWRVTPKPSTRFDFTGDGKADVVWADGSNGDWFQGTPVPFSTPTKIWTNLGIPVPGDYDGDGRFEPAALLLAAGNWVTTGAAGIINFPQPPTTNRPPSSVHDGPEAVPGMYDGNRTTIPAWYRQEDATWFIRGHSPIQFGSGPSSTTGTSPYTRDDYDRPVPADYDGDGRTDLGVWNPRTSMWKYRRSTDGVVVTRTFGSIRKFPAVADYNGDGKAELAVWGADGWQIDGMPSIDPSVNSSQALLPAVADHDGDGKADRGYWIPGPSPAAAIVYKPAAAQQAVALTTLTTNKVPVPMEMNFYFVTNISYFTMIWSCVEDPTWC